jgi:glycine/D-amino acid oxidase-like deaminating enzyme
MRMNRRHFIRTAALSPLLASGVKGSESRAREQRADVVIVGGGVGGCAAALAAARSGCSVLMTEETDWIGGQLTQQAVPPDEHPWIESFGCTRSYRRFRDGIRAYYRRHYPLTAEARAVAHLNPGNGLVSRLCHEPRVALAVLYEMLAPFLSSGRVWLLLEHKAVAASTKGDRVESVTVQNRRSNRTIVLAGAYFLDATELGDLLPLTGTEFVTGFESHKDTGEPHAPTEAQPDNQQSFTCCFAIDHRPGEDHTLDKPDDYDSWRKYVPKLSPPWTGPLLAWKMPDPITLKVRAVSFDPGGTSAAQLNLWLYRRILDRRQFRGGSDLGDICLVNWPQNDYWLGNLCNVKP